MHPLLLLALGGLAVATVIKLATLVPDLVAWAVRAIRSMWRGLSAGLLVLQKVSGHIRALAFGGDGSLADEIEVEEAELPPAVLRELRRRAMVAEDVEVK